MEYAILASSSRFSRLVHTVAMLNRMKRAHEEEQRQAQLQVAIEALVQHETNRYIRQRNKPKRKYRKYRRLEAHDAVYMDYFHPEQPTFEDKEFQQIFRVSKTIFEQLLQTCCNSDVTFTERIDAVGTTSICPVVKVLMCLKLLAYGASPSAFQDYFQMGVSTARETFKKFVTVLSSENNLTAKYMRTITKHDAMNLSNLHAKIHGI
jgi:hypothetical protein